MGQPHDEPTCCLIIALALSQSSFSFVEHFSWGALPAIDMLCIGAQLAVQGTTFENKNSGSAGPCLHDGRYPCQHLAGGYI